MAASAPPDQNVHNTLDQLNHARKLCLADPSLYIRIVPGCMPLISSNAHLDLRRWGADFLAETFALPVLSSEDKQNLVPKALPVLKEYLDTPGQDFAVVKSVVQAVASIYPLVFRYTVSTSNTAEFVYWNMMMEIKSNILRRMDSAAPGLRICCVKFIQMVVLTQTPGAIADPRRPEMNDISSVLVPRDHPLILAPKLEAEASGLLDRILGILQEDTSDALIVTATLNSLGGLLKSRPSIANRIINAVLSFNPFKMATAPLTPVNRVNIRSMERTTRNVLQNVLKRMPNHPQILRIQQYIERLAHTRLDVYDETASRKRPLPAEPSEARETAKRQRLATPAPEQTIPPLPSGPVSYAQLFTLTDEPALRGFDVKNIPIETVVRILVPLLASVDKAKLLAAENAIRTRYAQLKTQANQAAPATEEDEDYEPDFPDSETAEQVKNRVEMDTSEEYAVQMPLGPFELEIPRPLSAYAIDRLNARILTHFYEDVKASQAAILSKAGAGPSVNDRLTPMTFIERFGLRLMFSLGSRPVKPPKKLTDKFRQQILQYILLDWRHRIDLAISWLTEEWEADCELARVAERKGHKTNGITNRNPKAKAQKGKEKHDPAPTYQRWLGRLLDELTAFIGGDVAEVKILIRLLSEVPRLSLAIIEKVKKLALDPERVGLAVQALHYLVMFRPAVREHALDAIEDMWRNYDGAQKSASKPLNKWRPSVLQAAKAKSEGHGAGAVKAEA